MLSSKSFIGWRLLGGILLTCSSAFGQGDKCSEGIFSTITSPAVQKELELNEDAIAAVRVARDRFTAAWVDAGGGARIRNIPKPSGLVSSIKEAAMPPFAFRGGIKGAEKDERIKSLRTMMDEWNATSRRFEDELKATLSTEQYKRLKEINWQALKTSAFNDPEVIDILHLTDDQQSRILSITDDYWKTRRELGKEGDNEKKQEKLTEVTEKRDTQILEILSKAQLEAFVKIKGKDFDVNQLVDTVRPGGQK